MLASSLNLAEQFVGGLAILYQLREVLPGQVLGMGLFTGFYTLISSSFAQEQILLLFLGVLLDEIVVFLRKHM